MIKRISLSEIEHNPARQPRVEVDKNYVSEIFTALTDGATFPPITVFSESGGAPFFLADGEHRLQGNINCGFREIDADVVIGSAFDAFKHSLGANTEHGARRTNADKRRAVTLALQAPEFEELNDRAIGEICKVAHSFVFAVRGQLFSENNSKNGESDSKKAKDFPKNTKKSKDGKKYPATKAPSKVKDSIEIFDSNGIQVPDSLVDRWNNEIATVLDLQMHVNVIIETWPEKMYGKLSAAGRRMLTLCLEALRIIVCPECKGEGCKKCHKVGIISESPL